MNMSFIFLQASPLSQVADGTASYLPFVTGLCYMIAGIICVLGCMSVYLAFHNGSPDVTKRIMKVSFACLFFVSAANGLPRYFGMENSFSVTSGTGNGYGSYGNGAGGESISGEGLYYITLPNGRTAVIRPPSPPPLPPSETAS